MPQPRYHVRMFIAKLCHGAVVFVALVIEQSLVFRTGPSDHCLYVISALPQIVNRQATRPIRTIGIDCLY